MPGGNTLIIKESDGVTREHFVPDGFTFQMGGKNVTLADLKAGDHITAVITDVKQVTPVTVTKELKGKVLESSMGSILVQHPNGDLVKYASKDADGRDVIIIIDGKAVAFSDIHPGERLTATVITKYPPQVSTLRKVDAHVTPAPRQPRPHHQLRNRKRWQPRPPRSPSFRRRRVRCRWLLSPGVACASRRRPDTSPAVAVAPSFGRKDFGLT